eukprot:SAG11_NODE_2863_length_2896_cov_15.888809_1_plen_283_part_00
MGAGCAGVVRHNLLMFACCADPDSDDVCGADGGGAGPPRWRTTAPAVQLTLHEDMSLSSVQTGSYEWEEAGQMLLQFAIAELDRRSLAGDRGGRPRVLELGCGCGAVGLGLAIRGAAVALTDVDSLVESGLIRQNIDANKDAIGAAGVRWGAVCSLSADHGGISTPQTSVWLTDALPWCCALPAFAGGAAADGALDWCDLERSSRLRSYVEVATAAGGNDTPSFDLVLGSELLYAAPLLGHPPTFGGLIGTVREAMTLGSRAAPQLAPVRSRCSYFARVLLV